MAEPTEGVGKGPGEGAETPLAWIPVSPSLTSSPRLSRQRKKNPHEVVYNVSRGRGTVFIGKLEGRAGGGLRMKGLLPTPWSLPDLTFTALAKWCLTCLLPAVAARRKAPWLAFLPSAPKPAAGVPGSAWWGTGGTARSSWASPSEGLLFLGAGGVSCVWPLVENFTILGVDLGLPHRGPLQRVSYCKESYSPSLLQLAHAQPTVLAV